MSISVSKPCRRLLHLINNIGFGRVENLVVSGGEPRVGPETAVIREVKLGSRRPHPRAHLDDEVLAAGQVVALFECFTQVGNGVIESLEIQYGLPFRVRVEETILPEDL